MQGAIENSLPLRGARLLVVEDDPILLMDLVAILSNAGAEIAGSCCTVASAIETLDTGNVSAAVLDVRLAHETSAPVARQLDKHGIPFMFYTGQMHDEPDLETWRDRTIISKPAQAKTIVSAVAALLRAEPRLSWR
jgi:DNA-binding response OmpR family regulator